MLVKSLIITAVFVALGMGSVVSRAEEPIRIGLIEPFSGPVAAIGRDTLETAQYFVEKINNSGGVLGGRMIEVVPLDNAMNAEKTTQMLKKAVDDGIRFISQGVGSNHALNIIKFLGKHNRRNPDKSIVFLNHSAVTTAFTNELCSFWHFRFDANVDMKVAALVSHMGRDQSIKKVYMVNQNYAYGKSFQQAANKFLSERTPQIELVGDELIVPFGKVLDFTPYVAKIKASGADTVLTGNWGPDLVRFVKTAVASGLDTKFYTIYAGVQNSVAGIGKDDGTAIVLKQLTEMHENDDLPDHIRLITNDYLKRYGKSFYFDRGRWVFEMFAAALEKAGTDDPIAVATALEGMTIQGARGEVMMRPEDHQMLLPLVISTMTKNVEYPFIYEGTNYGVGWKTDAWVDRDTVTLPTTCQMKRPS